jgi:hypothetical protein
MTSEPPPPKRTPAQRRARQLAKHLRSERPDYTYLKDVFRHLRAERPPSRQRAPKPDRGASSPPGSTKPDGGASSPPGSTKPDGGASSPPGSTKPPLPRSMVVNLALGSAIGLLLTVVLFAEVFPLSEPPQEPPRSTHLAWAGNSLKGYTEVVYTHADGCGQPVHVLVDLYPPSDRSDLVAGRVAVTLSDVSARRHRNVRLWIDNSFDPNVPFLASQPSVRLPAQSSFKPVTDHMGGRFLSSTYVFDLNPRFRPYVHLAFDADWTAARLGTSSCWLPLPSLVNDATTAATAVSVVRNTPRAGQTINLEAVVGFDAETQPLAAAQNRLFTGSVSLDRDLSVPVPAASDPAFWYCTGTFAQSDCGALAVLSVPGAERDRPQALSRWSIVAGLLLALFADCLLLVLRQAFRRDMNDGAVK